MDDITSLEDLLNSCYTLRNDISEVVVKYSATLTAIILLLEKIKIDLEKN